MKQLITFLLFMLLASCQNYGQSISMQVLGNAGSNDQNSQLEWTLGELIIDRYENGEVITQGFHQGKLVITAIETIDSSVEIDFFPNPVISTINVKYQYSYQLKYELRDIHGVLVESKSLDINHNQINVESLISGMYFISIYDKSRLLKTAKIIKSR